MTRRRHRGQAVLLRPAAAFTDSSDFIDDNFSDRARLTSPLPPVPRSNLSRLFALDVSTDSARSGYGADQPHGSPELRFLRRRIAWPKVSAVVRTSIPPLQAKYSTTRRLAFNVVQTPNPKRVLFCVRRHVRRNVLFALRVAGHRRRSPGRGGSYHRTLFSFYRC